MAGTAAAAQYQPIRTFTGIGAGFKFAQAIISMSDQFRNRIC